MRFGIFDHMELGAQGLARLYEERLRMLEYADAAGFWCYHKAEHHFTPLDAAPSSTVFLAAASQRTERIRLGSLVMLLPFYEPLRLVEEICMLDHLSGGRLEVGVGKGISPAEHALWGHDPATARERFEEAFEVVRMGLSDGDSEVHATSAAVADNREIEPVADRYRRTGSAKGVPGPLRTLQKPHPGFWYPGNVEYAGRHRLHTITAGPPPAVAHAVETYRSGLEQPARDWNPGVIEPIIGAHAHIYLGVDAEAAATRARQAWAAYHRNLTQLWRQCNVSIEGIDPTFGGRAEVAMEFGALLAGPSETALEHIRRMRAATGIDYMTFAFGWGDLTHDETMQSMRLFVEEVMPEFAGADDSGETRNDGLPTTPRTPDEP